jgi:hypothetical protein
MVRGFHKTGITNIELRTLNDDKISIFDIQHSVFDIQFFLLKCILPGNIHAGYQ